MLKKNQAEADMEVELNTDLMIQCTKKQTRAWSKMHV